MYIPIVKACIGSPKNFSSLLGSLNFVLFFWYIFLPNNTFSFNIYIKDLTYMVKISWFF